MLCTVVSEGDQNHEIESPAAAHTNQSGPTDPGAQTNNTTRTRRPTETRYNLQANPTPKTYSDFLVHQISDAHAAVRPVSTREGKQTQPSQQQNSSENIR